MRMKRSPTSAADVFGFMYKPAARPGEVENVFGATTSYRLKATAKMKAMKAPCLTQRMSASASAAEIITVAYTNNAEVISDRSSCLSDKNMSSSGMAYKLVQTSVGGLKNT